MLYQLSYLPVGGNSSRFRHLVKPPSPRYAPTMTEPREHHDHETTQSGPAPLLSVRDLRVHFPVRSGILQTVTGSVKAVDGISFDIPRGTTLGLVGESGSGKTTAGRAILKLIEPTSGSVRFEGQDIAPVKGRQLRELRKRMQIVFQDPAGALNPRMRVGDIVGEPLRVHRMLSSPEAIRQRVAQVLDRCGMPPAAADRYPHEFSGGQRQRLVIARALATEPAFIVCDEPTSALDVSIQSQIINLLRELQADLGLTYLFISHDMAVIRHMCDEIAVMYRGKIVERGPRDQVLRDPADAYTRKLLSAVPLPRPRVAV